MVNLNPEVHKLNFVRELDHTSVKSEGSNKWIKVLKSFKNVFPKTTFVFPLHLR